MYLERALELAEQGRGLTVPNPVVGAVIVMDGQVVGEGFHTAAGQDHAEIVAMKDAARRGVAGLAGATMYVTLEPCCVFGRTPPCVPALLSRGLARVVVGAIDPSPQVNGRGLQQLQTGGVSVDLVDGDLALRAKRQNNGFRKSMVTRLPFVTYKYAMTLDGRVATDNGESKWISSAESRLAVHRMRSWADAVMVGRGTLEADDPLLTARGVECRRQPLRVVLDPGLHIRRDAALVQSAGEGPVLVICGDGVPVERRTETSSWGVEVTTVPESRGEALSARPSDVTAAPGGAVHDSCLAPLAVARILAERGVQNLLLEGGPTLAGAWWAEGLIDKVVAYVSPRIVSGHGSRSPLRGIGAKTVADGVYLREIDVQTSGNDVCVSGYTGEAY